MKVYCVQLNIAWEDKAANFARVAALLAGTPPEAGSLVILPEMFATGFSMEVAAIRDRTGGETEQFLSNTAQEHGVFLLAGVVTADAEGKGRNQSVIFGPEGSELARYTKLQPFTLGGESQHYDRGDGPIVFSWRDFLVSPFVCYDLRFPEHFRIAAKLGAQLITVIANWPVGRIQHWVTLLQARAIENQCFVAGVNRCGADPKLTYTGRSIIVSPKGEILADAGNGESIISADLKLDELLAYRTEFPFLTDMRI